MPEISGQPGNTVPILSSASTDVVRTNYQFLSRIPVAAVSSAQNQVLLTSQAGLIPRGAASSGSTIVLPAPEPGLQFMIYFQSAATSAATIIRTNSSTVDMVAGGGNLPTTNTAVQLGDINTEDGAGAWFIGLNSTRWIFWPMGNEHSSAYTSAADATTLTKLWNSVDSTG